MVQLDELGISVPVPPGFRRDANAEAKDQAQGGVLVRLVRDEGVAGSPRIDVVAEPKRERPTSLDEFLAQNLAEMTALEKTGGMQVTRLEQSTLNVGPRRGYRVRHEYVLTGGQVAITQVSTLLVVDGRGVAVTAVGRSELFAPLARDIDAALGGLRTPLPGDAPAKAPSLTQPLDLNRLPQPSR